MRNFIVYLVSTSMDYPTSQFSKNRYHFGLFMAIDKFVPLIAQVAKAHIDAYKSF